LADVKISQLPAASTPLAGTEEIPLVQSSTTKKITVSNLLTSANLGTPSAINLANATNVPMAQASGVLAVNRGGTGTATPNLVQGANVTITGTWPNQTIAAAGAAQVYPGAGIANSTGSAWGTSYTTTGTGTVLALATSPTFVTPVLGTPTSGNFSTGTFTWPTFNQNTTGTAANITASSNSTITTLSSLSLPGSQVSGNISGNAANVTGIVAVANGGTGTATPALVAGTNVTITGSWPNQTINATNSGSVTSVSGTGTVNGLTLTGTVTTTGSLTLGGTLDLSSPPAIGGTVAAAITGTTITASTKFVGTNFDAAGSGGGGLRTSSGANCLQWGGGGGVNLTLDGAFNMNPANASISIAPTGTGTLTINPATAGTINNMAIGGTTPAAGAFTTLSATTAIAVTSGGTGQTSYTDGQLLIGNSTGNTLTKATLTAGTNITITNAAGAITIAATGGGGSGDVVGPASSTDNALARFDTTTGKLLQNSVGILSDAGVLTGLTGLTSSGSVTLSGLTSGRVPYASTGGLLTDSANLLYSGTDLTVYGLTVGRGAGAVSTNTAVGASALNNGSLSGGENVGLGYNSAQGLTTGVRNTILGSQSGQNLTTGSDNILIGYRTVYNATSTGSNNVAVGSQSLYSNTTASNNTAVGYQAGYSVTASGANSAFGAGALYTNTANENSAFGYQAGYTNSTGTGLTAIGFYALRQNTTASNNTAVGYTAGYSNTTGGANTFIGRQSGYNNTTASSNVGIGNAPLYWNTTGTYNIAIGETALGGNGTARSHGDYNIAIGPAALSVNTASYNTAVGYQAGYVNTTGVQNTFLGFVAGSSNTTGNYNTLIGRAAGLALTTGSSNTFIGGYDPSTGGSGAEITTGSNNSILGAYNGNQNSLDIRTASNYIVLSDGDGNPRGFFDGSGNFLIGTTNTNPGGADINGIVLRPGNFSVISALGTTPFGINRGTDDGILINFSQAGSTEGNISVSGTTVSYNGGHLSRYAQTTTAKDESLVKGTVLSNLDEMNVYTKNGQPVDNEQLNKVKVSDTEGDVNVAGVFVNWSHDEDHNVDEINMAMTGDMIIRIAQGVTVVRGDLLMSAGDGTAKPQGDDIVRSKTVAKVTSNHVTCTYADGSYCVPCVLMAC
jgi:hypothetical protein